MSFMHFFSCKLSYTMATDMTLVIYWFILKGEGEDEGMSLHYIALSSYFLFPVGCISKPI